MVAVVSVLLDRSLSLCLHLDLVLSAEEAVVLFLMTACVAVMAVGGHLLPR